MASKRSMYKPVQTNVGKNRNRRPLAQGRLVTTPTQPSTTVRRLQQGVVMEGDEQRSAARSEMTSDDPSATPRRTVPQASQLHSPLSSPHIRTLDLSDSDDDPDLMVETGARSGGRQVEVRPVPHVMVCDASKLSGKTRIKCKVAYERSPATVICHSQSPPRLASAKRDEEIFQVSTSGGVTKAPITAGASPVPVISPLHSPISPRHHNRNQHADEGHIITVGSRSSSKRSSHSARKKHAVSRLAQPRFEDSGESEREENKRPGEAERETGGGGEMRQGNNPLPAEVTSDSETCSLFEYVPQAKNRVKTAERDLPPKSTKKKKGERFVASRYMQSAQTKKGLTTETSHKKKPASLNINRSSSVNFNSSSGGATNTSSKVSKTHYTTPQASSEDPFYCSTSRDRFHPQGDGSPDRRGHSAPQQGKTSTPTHDSVPNMTMCDASAIQPDLSMLSMDARQRMGEASGTSGRQALARKPTKTESLKNMQDSLGIAYAQYLQWHFLSSKGKMIQRQQEEDAMRQLHGLWELMEKTRKEKCELEREVYRLKHLNILDSQLHLQNQSLDPVIRVLPILKKNYSSMAQAVDVTRHQMAMHGVVLPEDQDDYMEKMEKLLLESEELLGTLHTLTKHQAPPVTQVADALGNMRTSIQYQCNDLNRCAELVSAVQTLVTQEMSLRIQDMQNNNN